MMMGNVGLLIVLVVLFFLVVVVAGVGVVVWFASQRSGANVASRQPEEDVVEILRRRYARGEITREEYDKMRQDLEA